MYVPLHHSLILDYVVVGRSGWQITSISSAQLFDTTYHIRTISDIMRQEVGLFGSVVRALDLYPGGPASNSIRDVEFFFKLCIIS